MLSWIYLMHRSVPPGALNVSVWISPNCLCQNISISLMSKLPEYRLVQSVHIFFCGGSVDGSKSDCGLFILDYVFPTQYTDTQVCKRLPGHLSSTRAELYSILEVLHIATTSLKDVLLFVDSQAALRSHLSPGTHTPTDCDIVNKCLSVIGSTEKSGARIHFTWVPSQVSIPFNEKTDNLAQLALQDETVDPAWH
ncbi:hypothetical protein E2C01_019373 [Portunus trituberculatus]|uniref:RNase H type-1 domain-containing protein n=1 Tax=Portunus trituberculatus TaxID=210409 RepID=A0A5B7DXQ7_PORTR|nr:hypothetical protein [Portunus trituberculatus]